MNITSRSRATMQISRILEADLVERSRSFAFLSNFVNDVPWVHIDIAGTAWTQKEPMEKVTTIEELPALELEPLSNC